MKQKQLQLQKITCSKKVLKLKKNVWLGWELNLQLRRLTTVCLHGFDSNVHQLFSVFSLPHCNGL